MAEPEKTSTALTATAPGTDRAPVRFGLAPATLDEAWRLAQNFAESDLVPKNFRQKPEDILVALQMGAELGLAPMQALQSIAVINGRPGVWGDGFLALIVASPLYRDHDEYYEVDGQRRDGLTADDLKKDTTAAVCTFIREGKPQPVTRRFTIAQAKKAGLLDKRDTPWQTFPDRMLAMRARSFAGRDAFPDLLRGIKTAEEVFDVDDDPAPLRPRVVRLSETRSVPASPVAAPSASAVSTVSAPVEAVDVVISPVRVTTVEHLLGGARVTFNNGKQIEVPEPADADELRKFAGTDHWLRVTCRRGDDDALYLRPGGFLLVD